MTRGRLFGKPPFFRATAIQRKSMFDKLTPMGALAIIGTSFSGYLFAENFLTPSPENWNLFVEVSLTMAALMVVKYAWEWFTQRRRMRARLPRDEKALV